MAKGDYRSSVIGGQPNIGTPAVAMVYTTTPSRFEIPDNAAAEFMGFIDVGMVSENVGIFCAGNGLVTVPRYSMNRDKLKEVLRIPEGTILVLNDLIGYPESSK